MPSLVAIVGAGEAGLACARALAGRARTVVVDRRPGEAADLEATAIRWDGSLLLAMGVAGPAEIAADALVIATGTRPLSRAELGLVGTRPRGVVSAPAACELAKQGLLRPGRAVVIGGGYWAARAVAALVAADANEVIVVAPDGVRVPLAGSQRVTVHEHLAPIGIAGDPVVARLECDGVTVSCDVVVLAHGLTAVRNVDGAVEDGVRTVYAQPLDDPPTAALSQRAGAEAAQTALALTGAQATIGPWWS